MALSKDSIRKLRAVKAAILAEPELYDQRNPPMGGRRLQHTLLPWRLGFVAAKSEPQSLSFTTLRDASSCEDMARAFDLTFEEFSPLYVSASGWPEPLQSQYEEAKSGKGRARVVARRIEHFITTGGL